MLHYGQGTASSPGGYDWHAFEVGVQQPALRTARPLEHQGTFSPILSGTPHHQGREWVGLISFKGAASLVPSSQAEWSQYLRLRRLCWHLHESRLPKAVLSLTRFGTVLLLLALPEATSLVVVFMVASILVRVPQVGGWCLAGMQRALRARLQPCS